MYLLTSVTTFLHFFYIQCFCFRALWTTFWRKRAQKCCIYHVTRFLRISKNILMILLSSYCLNQGYRIHCSCNLGPMCAQLLFNNCKRSKIDWNFTCARQDQSARLLNNRTRNFLSPAGARACKPNAFLWLVGLKKNIEPKAKKSRNLPNKGVFVTYLNFLIPIPFATWCCKP